MGEIWKPVVGYEGRYEVSSLGRVKSLLRGGKLRKPCLTKGGYFSVRLFGESGEKWKPVHHLVLEAFVGPRPDGMEACHFPNGPEDNSVENVRWDTKLSNHNDRRISGTIPMGITHGMAKLDDDKVREIRAKSLAGQSTRSIAREYGVSKFPVSQIILHKTWKHVA